MKNLLALVAVLVIAAMFPMLALAQDPTGAPALDLNLVRGLVVAVIPVLSGLVTAFAKRFVGFIPDEFLPIVAPIAALLIQAAALAFNTTLTPGVEGAGSLLVAGALGSTATGVHQIKAQLASR
jgi:hypothetical protein